VFSIALVDVTQLLELSWSNEHIHPAGPDMLAGMCVNRARACDADVAGFETAVALMADTASFLPGPVQTSQHSLGLNICVTVLPASNTVLFVIGLTVDIRITISISSYDVTANNISERDRRTRF